jgi:hypothetical protein
MNDIVHLNLACAAYYAYLQEKNGPWEFTEELKLYGFDGWRSASDKTLTLVVKGIKFDIPFKEVTTRMKQV